MIARSSFEELLASASAGGYHAATLSLSFIVDPSLVGVVVWGRPSREQILDLVRAHERMRPRLAPRTAALVDVRHLDWPDPSAFAAVVDYVGAHGAWLAEYIERMALVRSGAGPTGAASAGFFDVSARPFAVEVFTSLADALSWIGRADAATLDAEIEALFAQASGTPPLLRRLREQLEARPGSLTLRDAARALGTTERSLQRRLQSWKTSFQKERSHSQVRAAQRMLRERDATLAEIAAEVGCATLATFSAMFRRIAGETPTDWRRRHRPPRD